ncbi:MAG: glycosyl hydrolase family 18 protein [Lachnospiraceae bacterium]
MKRFFVSVLALLLVIVAGAAAVAGVFWFRKYAPSKEQADPAEWFGASGDQVALILDNELDETARGLYIDGQTYLPLTWVNTYINERFYWDSQGEQIIYALPDTIVYADEDSLGSTGKPLLIQRDEQVWLSAALVSSYTDIRLGLFDSEEIKRVFIDTSWDPEMAALVKRDSSIRVLGGVRSKMLTESPRGSQVTILETMDSWVRIRTSDGYLGYVQSKMLEDPVEQTLISTFTAPEYTSISLGEPVVLGWHQVTIPDANNTMEQLVANTKGLNVIAPTWFMLTDNNGNYDSLADRDYVEKAHAKGLQVWGVLDNFNKGENVQSEILFASTQAREKLISRLMKDVKTYNLDGINLDIEMIKTEAGPHYVQFIRELSVSCRAEGVILSVDNAIPVGTSTHYNRAEQGRVADYVIIMGYDEHTAREGKSSSASYGFVKQGIEDTLALVPKEKVINGIPVYTRLWKTDEDDKTTSTALGINAARKWVADNNVELYWQEELGQSYGEATIGSDNYSIWMEDVESIKKKMELIYENELAGVAVWKLGLEPAEIWDTVLEGLEGKTDT